MPMLGRDLAHLLKAECAEPILAILPKSHDQVKIPVLRRTERRWPGATPDTFRLVPNKPALEFEGGPTWSEIILVRLLERGGWGSAWVNNWRRALWRDVGEAIVLPDAPAAMFKSIESRTQTRGGGWDIFAWRRDEHLFIEAKMRGRDRLTPNQLRWLESALELGVPLGAFAVVEWTC
jgi:hypothetical protein